MKLSNHRIISICFAISIGSYALTGHSAVVTHLDFASWNAAVSAPVSTEDFNGFVSETPLGPAAVELAAGMSLQVDLDALSVDYVSSIIIADSTQPGIDGSNYAAIRLIENINDLATTMRLDFASGATAWGADFALLGGVGGGTFVIDVHSTDGTVLGTVDPASLALTSGGGSGFIGFSATGGDIASYLTFYMPAGGVTNVEAFSMDNIVVATVVPIPASIWLLGSGLLALVGWSTKKYRD